ncbi:MAG: LysR family transcriptional regulator [Anderseniella sp.]
MTTSRKSNGFQPDLSDLGLKTLQVFAAVEETRSISIAAQRMGVSKSSVSQHITNLETMLATSILDRTVRPLGLTPAGQILRHHAARVLEAMSDVRAELMQASLARYSELRLGIIDDLDATVTPELVTHLRDRFPAISVSVMSGRSDDLIRLLAQREVEVVLSSKLPDAKLAHEDFPVLREPFVLVATPHVFDDGGDLRSQLERAPYVQYNAAMPMGQTIDQQLRRLRIKLAPVASFDASRSVFAMMEKCGGWSITTPLCLLDSGVQAARLKCYPLPFAAFGRTIRLVGRSDELGGLARELAQVTRDLLTLRLPQELDALAPWIGGEVAILGDDGQSVKVMSRPVSI